MIKLPNGQTLIELPGNSFVNAGINSAIRAYIDNICMGRIDPDRMHIAMHPSSVIARFCKRIASVTAVCKLEGRTINSFRVFGVNCNGAEIERPGTSIHGSALVLPGFPGIGGNIKSRLLAFDNGQHLFRIAGRQGHGNSSEWLFRQSVSDLFPGFTAICAFIKPASLSAGIKAIRLSPELPHGCEQDVWI